MTHGRLIDADALIEDVRKNSASYFADDFAHEWVDRQPTIEERKKGEWKPTDGASYQCSVCGRLSFYRTYYCAHCGADMT